MSIDIDNWRPSHGRRVENAKGRARIPPSRPLDGFLADWMTNCRVSPFWDSRSSGASTTRPSRPVRVKSFLHAFWRVRCVSKALASGS